MKNLILTSIVVMLSICLTGCGTGLAGDSRKVDKEKISIDSILEDFVLSHNGHKGYIIGLDTLTILNMRNYTTIGRLEVELPEAVDLNKPDQIFQSIALSPDDKTVYITSHDPRHNGGPGSLFIVDVSNSRKPKLISETKLGLKFNFSIQILPDGKHMLATIKASTYGITHADLVVLDIQNKKKPKIIGRLQDETYSFHGDISISKNGKRAYLSRDVGIEIVNLEDLTLPRVISTIYIDQEIIGDTYSVITKDKKWLYAINNNNDLFLYNIEKEGNPRLVFTKTFPDVAGLEYLLLSPDEKKLYVTSMGNEEDSTLTIFDISDRKKLTIIKTIHRDSYQFVRSAGAIVSPDGKKIYFARVWLYVIKL